LRFERLRVFFFLHVTSPLFLASPAALFPRSDTPLRIYHPSSSELRAPFTYNHRNCLLGRRNDRRPITPSFSYSLVSVSGFECFRADSSPLVRSSTAKNNTALAKLHLFVFSPLHFFTACLDQDVCPCCGGKDFHWKKSLRPRVFLIVSHLPASCFWFFSASVQIIFSEAHFQKNLFFRVLFLLRSWNTPLRQFPSA